MEAWVVQILPTEFLIKSFTSQLIGSDGRMGFKKGNMKDGCITYPFQVAASVNPRVRYGKLIGS